MKITKILTTGLVLSLSSTLFAQLPTQAEDIAPLLVGESIPNITISTVDGETISFHDISREKPTVLVFYRGGWCPYCNRHLAALGEQEAAILALGYQIVAVSPDGAEKLKATVEKDEIQYRLFADGNGDFAKAIGIAFQAPERYGERLLDWSDGKNQGYLPVPSVFVLDTAATILYEHISPDYKQRLDGNFLLSVLKAINGPDTNDSHERLFLKESLKKWQNASEYTLELAKAMPTDQYGYKPDEAQRSFQEQLIHIGQNMTWLAGGYLGGEKFEHPLKDIKELSPEQSIELLTASLAFAEAAIAATNPDSLSITKDFFAGPMSRRQIIALMHDHHTHHRGQLIVYLRLKGIKPPKYRGW